METSERIALTMEEAAARLGVTVETAREWAKVGELPARKIGNRWYVDPRKLSAWVLGEETSAEVAS